MNYPSDFDTLVQSCHSAAIGEMAWVDLLRQTTSFVGGDKGLMMSAVGNNPYSAFADINFDKSVAHKYHRGFNARDPRKAISMRLKAGDVSTGQSFLPNRDIENTQYFQEITVPADVFDSVHAVILDNRIHGRCAISIQRPFGDEFFGEEEVTRMRAVLPYLSSAMQYSLQAGSINGAADTASFLVDRNLRADLVQGCESVLRHESSPISLSYRGEHLSLDATSDDSRDILRRMWGAAALGHTLDICIEMADGMELSVTVGPVPIALAWMVSGDKQVHMRFTRCHKYADESLYFYGDIYGLTKAESRILSILVQGHHGEAAADILGIAKETLRWHVKNMLAKTGESRREDMIQAATKLDVTAFFRQN